MGAFRLAWRQLVREKLRLLVAIFGVAFAVILIFVQLGFQEALFQSSTLFHEVLDGDVFLISPEQDFIASPKHLSRRRLIQALAFDGVESVAPVYTGLTLWKNPQDGSTRTIFVVGVDPSGDVLLIPEVRQQLHSIRRPDSVLFDRASRVEYGPIAAMFDAGHGVATEVANRRIDVVGLFAMGTSFGIDGTLITSDLNFLRLFPERRDGLINIGAVKLATGVGAPVVRDRIRASLPRDTLVLTKDEFVERERDYWKTSTPIGFVFRFGVIMGLVVGAIIVYQILFADVSDHLAEYATLKAMGYTNSYLIGVVLSEALVLAALGFVPGFFICQFLYELAEGATHLPLRMTLPLAGSVFALALAMCGTSGLLAVRKARSADPADVF